MQKSVKHLVTLAMFTTMALVIFVVEAQIPVPVPIPGIKLGLANIIRYLSCRNIGCEMHLQFWFCEFSWGHYLLGHWSAACIH